MKLWQLKDNQSDLKISKENHLLAKLLLNRNIDTDEKVENFLNPELKDFLPFSVFNNSEKVLQRISEAIQNKEEIVVYGDFDTDGVTSTAILYKTLLYLGANVDFYLPDREAESHGLNNTALLKIISKKKAKLIITVDCGISNADEVKLAKNFKTDIIITDHHEAPDILPDAFAVINPKAENSLKPDVSAEDIKSLCDLSGAGIAFKLASALLNKYNKNEIYDEILSIACIGTIGDIVPLLNENRHIVYSGLKLIRKKNLSSINKLLESAGIKDFDSITSETIAFCVVPRINATGRLKQADISLQLFVSKNEDEIDDIVNILNETNTKRQELCELAFERAVNKVESEPDLYSHSIIICDEETQTGIIGLSASKLVEKYNKPAFVMNKNGDIYRCSCRGLQGINIYKVLKDNSYLFKKYGGHEFAGGFAFDGNKHSFDEIQKAINNSVFEQTNGKELIPILNIDAIVNSSDISVNMIDTINKLQPFGAENPVPLFEIDNQKVENINFIGKNSNHLKMICRCKNDGFTINCIKWQTSYVDFDIEDTINMVFTPNLNEFNGNTTVQVMINDIKVISRKETEIDIKSKKSENTVSFIDCRFQSGGEDKIVDFKKKTRQKLGIYSEKTNITEYFNSFPETKNLVFDRDNIPKNLDMIILIDFPPSQSFIQELINSKTKKILFMKYENPYIDFPHYLAKIAGMMKYALNKLQGKTSIKSIRPTLLFDDNLILSTLNVLIKNKILNAEINKKKEITVSDIKSFRISDIKKDEDYLNTENKFTQSADYASKVNNAQIDELKQ